VGSKKYTRNNVGFSLRSWVQKNVPSIELVALCVRGFKKCARNVSEVVTLFMGSKKCTRNIVGYSLCLWVQKNVPAMSVKL
jgi:hypothetical protein